MTSCAFGAGPLTDSPAGAGLLHGLQLAAAAIVAQAVWGMAASLCPDRQRATVAVALVLLLLLLLFVPSSLGPIVAILLGALVGLMLCRDASGQVQVTASEPLPLVIIPRGGAVCPVVCAALLGLTLALYRLSGGAVPFDAVYAREPLVFGSGHMVLPWAQALMRGLNAAVVGVLGAALYGLM
jgi:chromate transporter